MAELDTLDWQTKKFNELTTNELYDILKLRIDVFVVEQTCFYPDLDNIDRDPNTYHCFVYSNESPKTLLAYSRLIAKGISYNEYVSIGRVVTASKYRAHKLGYALMEHSIKTCLFIYPNESIKISAQAHLERFYEHFNFVRVSEIYLEDNIPHIAMVKNHSV